MFGTSEHAAMRRMTVALAMTLVLAVPVPAAAQHAHVPAPPGWTHHHDTPPRDTVWTFASMAPGWHVTTGPGAVLYDRAIQPAGDFSLASQVFLFPRASDEGYGIFLGGRGIGTDTASYVAVLLRGDGTVSVQRRHAAAWTVLAPWTRHAAIKPNPGDKVILNHLRVRAGVDSLRVFVNDSSVLALPRRGLQLDGQAGLRVGAGLNLHVTTFDHTNHHAPVPVPAP